MSLHYHFSDVGLAGLKHGLSRGVSPWMFVLLLLTRHCLIVFWHASRMTAVLCASVQNYTDDAMPENEEAPADEAPGKAEDKDDDKDKDEEED